MMTNERGFSLMEILIAVAILLLSSFAVVGAMTAYDYQQSAAERSIGIKGIVLALTYDLSTNSQQYSYLELSTAPALYVLCYDRTGMQIPFSATENVGIVTVASTTTTRLCSDNFEVRITPSITTETQDWAIDGFALDAKTGLLVRKAQASFSKLRGF